MKTINGIVDMIWRAEGKAIKAEDGIGVVTKNKRERYYNWGGGVTVGDMKEVYRVEYVKGGLGGDTVELYHYETMTAQVWLAEPAQALYVYGESRSDADSVNTFLYYFGIEKQYTYRPVNGGFMEVE